MIRAHSIAACAACALSLPAAGFARGVSPYLPLNLSPDLDRKIERVLLLGDKPVMRRPIPAAVVLDALPKACARDKALCDEVRSYLRRFMHTGKLTHLRVSGSMVDSEAQAVLPNRHGLDIDHEWEASAHAYYQPNDYLLIAAGAIARDGETIPTGSLVSFGADFAQLDIGYRDHWLSPLNDSSSLISTQAPTMLSATLSNYEPISPFGFTYQIFGAEMSRQDGIRYQGGTTSGKPRLAGLQLGMEPADGYSLTVNRLTQYGGGARGGDSLSDFWDALTTSSNLPPEAPGEPAQATNRLASITSSILFQGRTPFGVHIEYAGEDNAFKGRWRLGATNLSLGIDFPILWRNFDVSYEISEWQNVWYTHFLYPLGLTNRGHVLGHWFGDNRQLGDAVGGRSHTLRGGWRLGSGDYLQATYRNLAYDSDWAGAGPRVPYDELQLLELDYSMIWRGRAIDAHLQVGRDVFGDSFARVGASFDFARTGGSRAPSEFVAEGDANSEVFVDVGAHRSEIREVMLDLGPNRYIGPSTDYHLGMGARRRVSERSDLGVRVELDRLEQYTILSVRAVDYRYRVNRKLALSGFFGAGRFDIGLPAYGYYFGAGVQYMNLFPGWDVGLDYRRHDKFTRDKVLPDDPPLTVQLPRRAFDLDGFSLYLSRRW